MQQDITFDNPQEIIDKFDQYIELLHKNKINKNNAFDHRINDQLQQIMHHYDERYQPVVDYIWQRYSTVVDYTAKIYGLCVDHVHHDAYKVVSEFNRSNLPILIFETAETGGNERGRSRIGHSTIETKEDAIITKKFDMNRVFDPYFKKQSAYFDANSVGGLLLSHLQMNKNLELLLESQTCKFDDGQNAELGPLDKGEGFNLQQALFPALNQFEEHKFGVAPPIMEFEEYEMPEHVDEEDQMQIDNFDDPEYPNSYIPDNQQMIVRQQLDLDIQSLMSNDYKYRTQQRNIESWSAFEY